MISGIAFKIFDYNNYNIDNWRAQAKCKDHNTNDFYLERGNRLTLQIKQLCKECPVREQCLEYAIKYHERFGIWGGMGHRSRIRYARKHHIN